jgi:hypothetical protein
VEDESMHVLAGLLITIFAAAPQTRPAISSRPADTEPAADLQDQKLSPEQEKEYRAALNAFRKAGFAIKERAELKRQSLAASSQYKQKAEANTRAMDTIEAQRRRVAKVLTGRDRESSNHYYNKQIQQQPVENRQELEKLNSTQARINAKARELDILTDLHVASGEAVIYQRFGQAKRADSSMKKAKALYSHFSKLDSRIGSEYWTLKRQVATEFTGALETMEPGSEFLKPAEEKTR